MECKHDDREDKEGKLFVDSQIQSFIDTIDFYIDSLQKSKEQYEELLGKYLAVLAELQIKKKEDMIEFYVDSLDKYKNKYDDLLGKYLALLERESQEELKIVHSCTCGKK